ncbi:MAG: N-acetylmuramoyl-L-alanine amidase [Burkholderiales bacterium]|nr:N-acetylmuramoyl-L-alanine amidase [Flavobacterium sp.]
MNKLLKMKALFLIILATTAFSAYCQTNQKFKVTLDAGHGGKDFGAIYNGHIEKNVALAVTLKVGKILESKPNIIVNYTRTTDIFIDLIERANIANRVDANIFVSMHCNANKNTVADGTETYVMGMTKNASSLAVAKSENEVITLEKDYKQKYEGFDPNNPSSMLGMTLMQEEYLENSISLASKVEDAFAVLGKKVRGGGVKQAPYMVLHKAYMTRVLIEMGFISNPVEGAKLDSEEGQNEIAEAIAEAIMSYKKEYFGSGSNENVEEKPSKKIIDKPIKESEPPARTEPVAEKPVERSPVSKGDNAKIIFKVQISATGKKLELNPSNFKGLSNVSVSSEGNLYKYTYGETADYTTAKQNLEEARAKGFASAYLTAFKDGKKVTVQEAISTKSE